MECRISPLLLGRMLKAFTTLALVATFVLCFGARAQGTPNYQGLWWASPAASESGWGINFAHQADTIFASWFTYDATGKGLWLVMTAPKTAPNTYAGTLYSTTGPAFNAVPFNPASVVPTAVGNGTITFTDANDGSFNYTVNGINQVKAITREVFGTLPTCATATGSLAAATNYTDLWWAAPAGSESGWGINLNHEGTTIFATWFTYALNGTPMWLVVTAPRPPRRVPGTLSNHRRSMRGRSIRTTWWLPRWALRLSPSAMATLQPSPTPSTTSPK